MEEAVKRGDSLDSGVSAIYYDDVYDIINQHRTHMKVDSHVVDVKDDKFSVKYLSRVAR